MQGKQIEGNGQESNPQKDIVGRDTKETKKNTKHKQKQKQKKQHNTRTAKKKLVSRLREKGSNSLCICKQRNTL